MTTIAALQPASRDDLYSLLVDKMRPKLVAALESAGSGQRVRVTTLPEPVMDRVCERLQDDRRWVARVLTAKPDDRPWRATATKLIELRNALAEPLLVFIPPGLRTAAEDSLDIATFTELSLAALATDLVDALLAQLPGDLRRPVDEMLGYLRESKRIRNSDEEVDYLLTVLKNGASLESAGGAIHVFGLVPDFELFRRGDPRNWLHRNLRACDVLADGHPLQTAVLRLPLKPNTIQPQLFSFLRVRQRGDVRSWAREIASLVEHRALAIDRWEFADSGLIDELRLLVEPLTLPRQIEDTVAEAAQLPVLNLEGKDALKVAFRSIPGPTQVPSWKSWRVQILQLQDGAATVSWESNSFPKPQKQAKVTRAVKVQDLQHLEEGVYFFRVDAYDTDGALLTKPRRIEEKDESSRAENESERFLVVRGKAEVVPQETRAVYATSLLDAWARTVAKLLGSKKREAIPERAVVRGEWSQPMGAPLKGDAHFELEGDGFAGFAIVVPSVLRRIERDILERPEHLAVHSLSFHDARTIADVEVKLKEETSLGSGPEVDAFVQSRSAVFRAIYEHHFQRGKDATEDTQKRAGLVETVDLAPYAELVERYAAAYIKLAEVAHAPSRSDDLADRVKALAQLDVIELGWRRGPGDPGRALLLAPTHPLRLLWHLRHTLTCASAFRAWEDGTRQAPNWREYIDQLREDVLPMNLPMVLFDRRRRGYVEHTPLTRFWSLYLPDRGDRNFPLDAVATRDRVMALLGVSDEAVAVTSVDTWDIALRLYEYIAQHPYVEQLRLNVFNPGDGRLVADVLRNLETVRLYDPSSWQPRVAPPALRYAVTLFAAAEVVDTTGDGLEMLLDPDRQVSEDDEFTLGSSNHLLPKLVFARIPVAEFLQTPDQFSAHVSLLLEQFVVQSRVGRIDGLGRGSFVGGLVQEPETQLELQSGGHFGWVKGLRPAVRRAAEAQESLLGASATATQSIQASFAKAQSVEPTIAPVVALELDPAAQALLKRVHEVSDWVLTVDRNLGLDYFDSPSSSREAGYLLDFAPEYLQEDRQRILLTTRSHVELESLVRPIMNRYGLPLEPGDEVLVLESLRSLSGRLALRLEGGRNQAAEVVGLLLARWLLDRAGLLEQRLVIPLDAHRGWFERNEGGSQRRADLLLVGFAEPNILRLDIVEVKLREELTSSARSDLYAQMRRQTENTERHLRERFAQDLYPQPRADALLRAKELASALGFYVRRARRYDLLSVSEAERAARMLEHLDDGYELDMRSLGVVFEHKGNGSHVDEEEPGFVVHRFGGDKARQLLAHAASRMVERVSQLSERLGGDYRPAPVSDARAAAADDFSDREIESFRAALSVGPVTVRPNPSPRPRSVPLPARETKGDGYGPTSTPIHAPVPAPAVPTVLPPDMPAPPPVQTPAPEGATAGTSGTLPSAGSFPSPKPVDPSPPRVQEPARPALADVLLGANELTPQYGVLGKSGSQKVGLDLTGCNTISLFGVQGFGKSYTLGVIAEMACARVAGINELPAPLATVIFHYHKSDAYEPEYASSIAPNRKQTEVERLLRDYAAHPAGLQDVVLLAPEAKVEQRRQEYPGLTVEPIKFASSELGAESWKFLLGAYGNDSLYIRQLVAIMRRHRSGLTIDRFRQEIAAAGLPPATNRLADDRLNLAEPYIDDSRRLGQILRPGRTIIVDLRDEWIEKDEALGLFVVMLHIFAGSKFEGRDFNKLVVFDEAHKYITESDLIGQVVETIREMRHQATSVVIASQDPLSVPRAVIELTSILLLHRMTSPQWLKHLKTALTALDGIEEGHVASLAPGEALVWAQRSTDKRFTTRPQKLVIRPRFTQHGGGTKTAVAGATIR